MDKMVLFKIRIYEPSAEKGSADKLVFASNFYTLLDATSFIDEHEDSIVKKHYKVNITTQEVDL